MPIIASITETRYNEALAAGSENVWKVDRDYIVHEYTNPAVHCKHYADPEFKSKKGPECSRFCFKPSPEYWEKKHIGMCVEEFERNGYHDSDFYMTYYVPEKDTFYTNEFATTRAGCGAAFGSCVDASPEIMERYEAWKIRQDKLRNAYYRRRTRKKIHAIAKSTDLKFSKVKKIFDLYGEEKALRMSKLLTTNLRSKFKISLRDQLLKWLRGESTYNFPFTIKQLNYI